MTGPGPCADEGSAFVRAGRIARGPAALAALLALLVVLLFGRSVGFGFVTYDDEPFLLRNAHVAGGFTVQGLAWATSTDAIGFQPLAWASHMLDFELFGSAPAGPHAVNVLLHAGASALLFLFLTGATGASGASFCAALLFALHPLRVESVAWVFERKDVLSVFLACATLVAWGRWARSGRSGARVAATALAVAAILSKPMLVTLPLLLLVVERWPLRRSADGGALRPLLDSLREQAPLLLVSACCTVLTVLSQQKHGAVVPLDEVSPLHRLGRAAGSVLWYVRKTLWPTDLAVFYPLGSPPPGALVAAELLVLAGVTAAAVLLRRRAPYALAGWTFYLVALAPVSGLLQAGRQATADRYSYLPSVGLLLVGVFGARDLLARFAPSPARLLGPLLTVSLGSLYAAMTWVQLPVWHDSGALYEHALATTGENWLAANNLGSVRIRQGDVEGGLALYRETLRLRPGWPGTTVNMVAVLVRLGRRAEAFAVLDESIRTRPTAVGLVEAAIESANRPEDARRRERALVRMLVLSPDDAWALRELRLLGAARRRHRLTAI